MTPLPGNFSSCLRKPTSNAIMQIVIMAVRVAPEDGTESTRIASNYGISPTGEFERSRLPSVPHYPFGYRIVTRTEFTTKLAPQHRKSREESAKSNPFRNNNVS
jgi:hypothetical protein